MAPNNNNPEYEYENELHDDTFYEYIDEFRGQLTFITDSVRPYIAKIEHFCDNLRPVLDEDETIIEDIEEWLSVLYDINGEISRERIASIQYDIESRFDDINNRQYRLEFNENITERHIEYKCYLFVILNELYLDYLEC